MLDLTVFLVYNSILQTTGEVMSVRIESRSVEHAGGRYDLVIAAAQRLRELKRRSRETNNVYVTPIDALLEMQAGQINIIDYMAKVK